MFSGYRKEEKPFSGPDSGKKAPKPAPAPKAQAPRKSFFSLTGGPGVIQRIKLKGVDVNFKDQTVLAAIKAELMKSDRFSLITGMARFAGLTPDQAAEGAIRLAAPILERSLQKCGDLAAVAGLVLQIAHQQQFLPGTRLTAYSIGGKAASFDEEDWQALKADSLLKAIRVNAEAPLKDRTEVNMSDKGLRYTDFYSRSAMREEVTRRLIERRLKAEQGKGRTKTMYTPVFSETGSGPDYKAVYSDATFHHREPLSSLTKKFTGNRSDQDALQRHEWQPGNLVFGPGRNRRVYEPGDARDVEADEVFTNTEAVIEADSSQPGALSLLAPPTTRVPIRAESSRAAMRTTYLQQFYHDCRRYQQPSGPGKEPRDLIEQANRMLARFSLIEIRHKERFLLDGLEVFIKVFSIFPEQSPERVGVVKWMIGILLAYGRREDARYGIPRGAEGESPSSSSVPSAPASASSSSSSSSSSAAAAAAAPPFTATTTSSSSSSSSSFDAEDGAARNAAAHEAGAGVRKVSGVRKAVAVACKAVAAAKAVREAADTAIGAARKAADADATEAVEAVAAVREAAEAAREAAEAGAVVCKAIVARKAVIVVRKARVVRKAVAEARKAAAVADAVADALEAAAAARNAADAAPASSSSSASSSSTTTSSSSSSGAGDDGFGPVDLFGQDV